MTTINLEDLTAEVSPEEVEEAESGIESKEVDQQHSPFAHLMSNLLQGGGRRRKQGYRGKWSTCMFESRAGPGEIMGPCVLDSIRLILGWGKFCKLTI